MTTPIQPLSNHSLDSSLLSNNLEATKSLLDQGKKDELFRQILSRSNSVPSSDETNIEKLLTDKADKPKESDEELQTAFQNFVGQTLFTQLISSMRTTQGEPAYFHGGQAEKIFQGQLDQVMSDELTKSSAKSFSEPMYELFKLQRK